MDETSEQTKCVIPLKGMIPDNVLEGFLNPV